MKWIRYSVGPWSSGERSQPVLAPFHRNNYSRRFSCTANVNDWLLDFHTPLTVPICAKYVQQWILRVYSHRMKDKNIGLFANRNAVKASLSVELANKLRKQNSLNCLCRQTHHREENQIVLLCGRFEPKRKETQHWLNKLPIGKSTSDFGCIETRRDASHCSLWPEWSEIPTGKHHQHTHTHNWRIKCAPNRRIPLHWN